MHILLFDWNRGGHHGRYLRHFAMALAPFAKISIACPGEVAEELAGLPANLISLGSGRPAVRLDQPLTPQHARLAAEELDLMEQVTASVRPDHIVNLYGDPVIRWFAGRKRPFPAPVSFCIFFVRDHYRKCFQTALSARERLRARFLRWNLERCRARPDVHTLFFLDQEAAEIYRRRPGASVRWFPEPPVARLPNKPSARQSSRLCIYGSLAPRKGIELVSRAICEHAPNTHLTLAGSVDPQFATTLDRNVDQMRAAGAQLHLRLRSHNEQEGLAVLAESAGTILAYPAHYGMSRVLLESCSVGTPVITHDFGLLGHLVRQHHLGVTVDCANPKLLGDALKRFAAEPDLTGKLGKNLSRFHDAYSTPVFQAAVGSAFASPPIVEQLAASV